MDGRVRPPSCDLLGNCTPLGMGRSADQPDLVPVCLDGLAAGTVVADLNPESADTAFRRASAAGFKTSKPMMMTSVPGFFPASSTALASPCANSSLQFMIAARPAVARLLVFLASEHAGYINGATVDINGGFTSADRGPDHRDFDRCIQTDWPSISSASRASASSTVTT